MTVSAGEPSAGVLDPRTARTKFELRKHGPGPALAPFVQYYWHLRWDLSAPFTQRVVPHPVAHLVFEADGAWVYGVPDGLFRRTIAGRGQVLGVRFAPGGLRPWLDRPVAALTGRRLPAADLVPGLAPAAAVLDAADPVAAAEAALGPLVPEPDPVAEEVRALVEAVEADRGLTRVDELARRHSRTVRSVQRLFHEHVGASPKRVIRCYRMHEAAARAERGAQVDWAGLAADLGFSDQSHFTREFTAVIGVSPTRYAAAVAPVT